MVGGVRSWYHQIPSPLGGRPANWGTIILQKFSHRSQGLESHARLPSLRVWHWRRSSRRICLWRPVGLDCRSSTGLGETDSTLRGCTQGLTCTRTQGKSSDPIRAWARPTCWSWRVSGEAGGSCGPSWGQGHWWWRYQEIFISVSAPGGCHIGTKTWSHETACSLRCWDTSGQTTKRAGTQPHPPAGRLPKVFLSPHPPLDTPLDTAPPTRGTRPSSVHQRAGTSLSRQEACKSL